MNQLTPSFALDPITIGILILVVIIVFSLHTYLQRLIGKPSLAGAAPTSPVTAGRSVKPAADERRANVKR